MLWNVSKNNNDFALRDADVEHVENKKIDWVIIEMLLG